MTVGECIRAARKQRGLTQAELSERAHISRSYLCDAENNRYHPSVDTLQRIADVLAVPVGSLMGDSSSLAELVAADNDLKAAYDLLHAGGKVPVAQLSRAKQKLIADVAEMPDDQVEALQRIVDSIIVLT